MLVLALLNRVLGVDERLSVRHQLRDLELRFIKFRGDLLEALGLALLAAGNPLLAFVDYFLDPGKRKLLRRVQALRLPLCVFLVYLNFSGVIVPWIMLEHTCEKLASHRNENKILGSSVLSETIVAQYLFPSRWNMCKRTFAISSRPSS